MIARQIKRGARPEAGPVAIIGPVPPPYGGMALQGQALAQRLSAEGISASVIPTNPKVFAPLGKIKGIRTLAQGAVYLFRLFQSVPRVEVVHILAASYFYFFARVVPAILIGRLFGRRVILNYRGGEAPRFLSICGPLVRPLLRLASMITVPSSFLVKTFLEHNLNAVIVPNLIDLDRFRYRQRSPLRPRFLISRNLEPMYNIKMALRAYEIVKRDHPGARLEIVGSGTEEAALTAWVSEKGLKDVVFHGAITHQQMPQFLNRADILLNPTNVDNLPMSLLEAFASGVAVVSTNVGGIPDLLGDSAAALLVGPHDHEEMAARIMELLSNNQLATRTAVAARGVAEKYCWEAVRNRLLKVYYPDSPFPTAAKTVESEPL
jgi:glycosyltransferase involved in cell wall biosynthesis